MGTLPTFKTSFGQVFYTYATGTVADGTRTRITPAAFYYFKSFGAFGEYVRSSQAVTRGLVSRDVANHAWETTASYVLTGEAASERGVRPRNNFDPAAHHWGALQVIGRYAVLTVDDEAFAAGLAGAGASQGSALLGDWRQLVSQSLRSSGTRASSARRSTPPWHRCGRPRTSSSSAAGSRTDPSTRCSISGSEKSDGIK